MEKEEQSYKKSKNIVGIIQSCLILILIVLIIFIMVIQIIIFPVQKLKI